MLNATVVIPNYNGKQFLEACLESLKAQGCPVILVDNGSTDESARLLKDTYPWVTLLCLDHNYGFCRAVNEGIRAAKTKYVILLNNDTAVKPGFAKRLVEAMEREEDVFSCQAKMLQMDRPDYIDNAGDFYCALGWARTRGKNKKDAGYEKPREIFSACAGAAIYRRDVFREIGCFDERHFAYLEDVDIGYRARIAGYRNFYEPRAVVLHKGSAASGSRYNRFKVYHASRNNLYLLYKNMSRWQLLLNLPLLFAGWLIKAAFFAARGLGLPYLQGSWQGILLARRGQKTPFLAENFDNCWKIQLQLWKNLLFL